jgi:indole-3-glycerol phosphate synthase
MLSLCASAPLRSETNDKTMYGTEEHHFYTMAHILDQILAHKRLEVAERKTLYPTALLERSLHFAAPVVSLRAYLTRPDALGVIAELKRASPSKGIINQYVSVERTSIGYMQAGASALSVLTDERFFHGSNDDLKAARKFNYCPILRKDFTVDEYQIIEARSIGADAILLIAAALAAADVARLAAFARQLGLEVLLEVHNADELRRSLDAAAEDVTVVGVNNRDLQTFSVSLGTSLELAEQIPASTVKISESGISTAADVHRLRKAGFQGFLIGEQFMRHSRPEQACAEFIRSIKTARAA